MKKIGITLVLMIFIGSLMAGQEAQERTSVTYKVHWLRPEEASRLIPIIEPPGYCRTNDSLSVLTVRATAAEHMLISELLARFDIPPTELEFQFYLLRGTSGESGVKNGVPDDIKKVLEEVGSLTRYNHFELVDTPTLRFQEGREAGVSGKGVYFYDIEMGGVKVLKTGDPAQIQVDHFRISFAIPISDKEQGDTGMVGIRDVGVNTSFTIKDNETIVLGASQIREDSSSKDAAIITVLTAKIR